MSVLLLIAAIQSAQPATPPAPDKKICRREATLGSILPRRMCHTAAEWAAVDRANRANADNVSGRRQLNPIGTVQ